MDVLQVALLALLQGLTEFLPISSSGHLIIVPRFLGWPDQGLAFDVAVHFGTLIAVVSYFRHELRDMGRAWLASVRHGESTADSRLAWAVLWGTVPVGVAGLAFADLIEQHLRTPVLIATTTALFGVMLWVADLRGRRERPEYAIGWRDVLGIGLAQCLALIPGTSRAGVTMTMGLVLGLSRAGAARYSFLSAIPVIFLAGAFEVGKLAVAPDPVSWDGLGLGILVSAVSAHLSIRWFLHFVQRSGMAVFMAYRVALAGAIFYGFA